MIHDDEREIIEFLHAIAEGTRYERRVWLAPLGVNSDHGSKTWMLYLEERRPSGNPRPAPSTDQEVAPLNVNPDDIASLHSRGYLDGPDPRTPKIRKAYTLTQKGRDLRDRGYVETPDRQSGGPIQYVFASGGNNAIAQTGSGDITQHVGASGITAIRELLAELREALAQADMDGDERQEYRVAVDRLDDELVAQSPRIAVILRVWAVIQTIGTAESFVQAGERAVAIVHALGPHMQHIQPLLSK